MSRYKHMYDEVRSQGYTMVPHSTTYVNPFYIWQCFLVLFPFSTLFPEYVLFCLVDKREIERVIFPTPPCALSKSFSNSYELGGEKDNWIGYYDLLELLSILFGARGSPNRYEKVRWQKRSIIHCSILAQLSNHRSIEN